MEEGWRARGDVAAPLTPADARHKPEWQPIRRPLPTILPVRRRDHPGDGLPPAQRGKTQALNAFMIFGTTATTSFLAGFVRPPAGAAFGPPDLARAGLQRLRPADRIDRVATITIEDLD